MWVFESVWVIGAECPFLHSLDVPIKLFTNSLTNKHWEGPTMFIAFKHSCRKVVWLFSSGYTRDPPIASFSIKNSLDTQTRFWVNGEWNRPYVYLTFTLKYLYLCNRCTAQYACTNNYLRCTKCKAHGRVSNHVISHMKKRVPIFLILEALCFSLKNKFYVLRWFVLLFPSPYFVLMLLSIL